MNSGFTITSECHCCCLVQDGCSFVSATGEDGSHYWELICPECRKGAGLEYEKPVILMVNFEMEVKGDAAKTETF